MADIASKFDWSCYINSANSRFIAGKTGALQSNGASNIFLTLVLLVILIWSLVLWSEYQSIWYISERLSRSRKIIHLHGMAEYAEEILSLTRPHFNQILRLKYRVKPISLPRIRMPVSLDVKSIKLLHGQVKEDEINVSDPSVKLGGNIVDRMAESWENLSASFYFDCTKTTFVSAHWGVPVEIVESISIPPQNSDSFDQSFVESGTQQRGFVGLLRHWIFPLYGDKGRLLLEDRIHGMGYNIGCCGEVSLLSSNRNYCSSEPICFGAGKNIECTLRPNRKFVKINGTDKPIWEALSQPQYESQRRIPLVIVLYSPWSHNPKIFNEEGVETHQGYAEITLVNFSLPKPTPLTAQVLGLAFDPRKIRVQPLKKIMFCDNSIRPQEPMDMFGMGDEVDTECLICISNKMDTVLLPCGHSSFCFGCLNALRNEKCPVCRSDFVSYVKIPLRTRQDTES